MFSIEFPNPRTHEFSDWIMFGEYYYDTRDIIGFGGDLTIENLRIAYHQGIFPWHIEGLPLPWFCPEKRAILQFDQVHIPKSLRKEQQKHQYTFTIDKDFAAVITECAKAKRSDSHGTWITQGFIDSYIRFHEAGDAHSVEVWENEMLVGGLYGVDAKGVFCGESMFHLKPNTSKFALLHLVEYLKSRGATWLDIQVMTPHFKVLGANEIPRREFLDKLEETQKTSLKLF